MLASWIVLIGSQSKTSLICVLFLTVFFLITPRIEFASGLQRIVYIAGATWFVILFGLVVYVIKPDLLTLDGSLQLIGKERHLTGRTTVWLNAWALSTLKPWLGWSFDSNLTVLHYMKSFNNGVAQFLSGYVDLLVRAGWVGITLFIMFLVQFTMMLLNFLKFNYRTGICYLSLFITVLIHNFTEASFLRDTHVFWFLIIVIYFDLGFKKAFRGASQTAWS